MSTQQQRGQWSGGLAFVLASAGSAIGLGNLWKFPYLAYENQGGAFVLVYLAAIALVGIPIMAAEILLGRRTQRSPVGAFKILAAGRPGARLWPGVGLLGVTAGFVILSYYSVVAGWTLRYIVMALGGRLDDLAHHPAELESAFRAFLANGAEQTLCHFLFMALTTGVVFFGVRGGIERLSKLMMPFLLAIMTILVAYSATTPGWSTAVQFLFNARWEHFRGDTILLGLGQCFFSLSLGMGAMLTYGSYMRPADSIPRGAVWISLLDSAIALMACLVMFSIIFTFDFQVSASAAILFTTLPTVFFQLPGGGLISGLFYILIAIAALTSTVSLLEVVTSYAIDELGWSRRRASLTLGGGIFALGVLCALSFGGSAALSTFNPLGRDSTVGVFGTLDFLAANWMLPVGGLLIALFTGWLLGPHEARAELESGHGPLRAFGAWRFLIRFAAPLGVAAIIVSVILGAEYQ